MYLQFNKYMNVIMYMVKQSISHLSYMPIIPKQNHVCEYSDGNGTFVHITISSYAFVEEPSRYAPITIVTIPEVNRTVFPVFRKLISLK